MQSSNNSNFSVLSLLLLVSVFAPGCSILKPKADLTQFYVLRSRTVTPTGTRDGDPSPKINVGRGSVATYLQSTRITVEDGPNRVKYLDLYHWAEPLSKGIGRVLGETLAQKLNAVHIPVYPDSASDPDGYEIRFTVNRFEGALNGAVTFDVSWKLRDRSSDTTASETRSVYVIPADGSRDTTGYVQRLSNAIGRWADDVAVVVEKQRRVPRIGNEPLMGTGTTEGLRVTDERR